MKGLFIGSYPNPQEPFRSVFFRNLVHEMADNGIDCYVISCVPFINKHGLNSKIPQTVEEHTAKGNVVKVFYPKFFSFSAKKIGKFNTMYFTQRNIEHTVLILVKKIKINFDFIYGHFFLGGGLTAAKVGRFLNVPAYIAYGECSFETEVSNKYSIKLKELEGVKGIIAVSSANKIDIESREFAKNIPTLLALNAIDDKKFYLMDKNKCREKFNFDKDDFIVGFIGYFIERKGAKRVWDACCELDGVKMAFAGQGPLGPGEKNVIFAQPINHDDVPAFLNAVDIFVLPTLNEGCCNAVIEALSCGKPVISSNLPFNHDVLNTDNSILINPNSIEDIKNAVIELRDNKTKFDLLSENAVSTAKELTLSKRAKKIIDFIYLTK